MTDFAKLFCEISLSLTDKETSHDQISGRLQLNRDNLDILKKLAENQLADGSVDCIVDGNSIGGVALEDIEEKYFHNNIKCEVTLHKSDLSKSLNYAICNNWFDLLNSEYSIKKPVESVFFIEGETYLNSNSGSLKFNNYLNLHQVFDLISFLSKSTNSWDNTIFYQRPIKFVFSLSEQDLDYLIDTTALTNLKNRDLHQEAIVNLMCKEVVSFVKDIDERQRVSYLVQNFNSLISNILLSYQSYTDNYSFDKVRKEYNEKKTEYIKKINDTFDSVATKMLAVPASIWFATAQISPRSSLKDKLTNNYDYFLVKNSIVLVAVLLIVIILGLNIFSQRNTLKQLKSEYDEVFDNLKDKFTEEENKLSEVVIDINKRYKRIKSYICISLFICTILMGSVFLLYFKAF
ncbi:hypothetical protein [Acinetobacter pollinis]|uniref:Uncharacterized protein n=1 Tax=Acinetobacter pollinis TaxID=2605270 RepID=A0ABU6DQ05_9GAMM|nr:hypothetical protein [Acinetobacter pollinis]MEB5475951.1 hypothetical protein [Acinetobacter pollinis]